MNLKLSTTLDIIGQMNRENIQYAVLRNYEEYPEFGHDIDLVVSMKDLSRWAGIVRECALANGWSAVTMCEHWAQSTFPEHTIQILRLYTESPVQFLQIDAFHSFLIVGCPLFDEATLLRGRVWDERGFYRIDEEAENVIRLLQIAKLVGRDGPSKKVERYRNRLLAFTERREGNPFPSIESSLSPLSVPLSLLKSGRLQRFKAELNKRKVGWLTRRMIADPLHISKLVMARLMDYGRMISMRPCGFVIHVWASDMGQRERLEIATAKLVNAHVVPLFSASRKKKVRRKVKSLGGVVFDYVSRDNAEMVIDRETADDEIEGALLHRMIERHPKICEQRNRRT